MGSSVTQHLAYDVSCVSRPAFLANKMALHPANILLEKCHASLLQDDGREYMMGVDEAGRGPTLGPMVYGSAFCAVDDEHRLRKMGFNDSKQLTEAKREQLWNDMQTLDFIGWKIRSLEATEISEGMLRRHQKCATTRRSKSRRAASASRSPSLPFGAQV